MSNGSAAEPSRSSFKGEEEYRDTADEVEAASDEEGCDASSTVQATCPPGWREAPWALRSLSGSFGGS